MNPASSAKETRFAMTRSTHNAFHRNGPDSSGAAPSRLNPLRAAVHDRDFGAKLKLSPMRAADILPVWREIGEPDNAANLLVGLDEHDWNWRGRRAHLTEILAAMHIAPAAVFDRSSLVLTDLSLAQLLRRASSAYCSIVRIEGPIESLDAEWIARSIADDRSPLEAEVRASASVTVQEDRRVGLHVRDRMDAIKLAGENFRYYVAALLNEPASRFAAPPPSMIEYLIGLTGQIKVRPIETDVNVESIDIGVSTPVKRSTGPARYAMVYDLPSHSWHFDEE